MKKINLFILLILGLFLSGCSQNNGLENNSSLIDKNTQVEAKIKDTNVTLNNGSANIKYKNVSITAENVTVTLDKTGVYEVNLSIKNNVSLNENMPIEQWCIEGKSYDMKNPEGVVTKSTILGIENYKDKIYCKANSKSIVYGMSIDTNYYFDYGAKDVWAQITVNNKTSEIHINNN